MDVNILRPDEKCFETNIFGSLGHTYVYLFDKVEYVENLGMMVYYKDCKLPKHGFPFPDAIKGINVCKRLAKIILKNVGIVKCYFHLNKILEDYYRAADSVMAGCWIKDEYLCPMARELKKFSEIIMTELGVSKSSAKVIAHIFENDDAYRFFFQDLMGTINKNNVLSPKTYLTLIKTIKDSGMGAGYSKQLIQFSKLMMLVVLIPRFRRAIKKGLEAIDFSKLQFDEYDRFWILNRNDWNFLGMTHEQRKPLWVEANGGIEPQNYYV